jgi:DMSO/TMAO reductase YedYZ molybdopterin-dependent catalytic subunit
MRQPGSDAQGIRAIRGGAGTQDRGPAEEAASEAGAAAIPPPRRAQAADEQTGRTGVRHRLPPGQYVQSNMPVLHYGPVPGCNRSTWDLRVYGATAGGGQHRWDWDGFRSLPVAAIVADFHCVTKFSVLGVLWRGVPAAELLSAVPPAAAATHVMVWADYGYGANLPLDVLAEQDTLLATHRDDKELAPEQGYPVRLVVPSRYGWKNVKWVRAIEYMAGDRRGFWEERGYHNNADPWLEQRYSYQERPGEGPPL